MEDHRRPHLAVTPRQASLDVMVVLALSAVYVLVGSTGLHARWIIPGVLGALLIYAFFVLSRRGETWKDFGVRLDNLRDAMVPAGLWTLLAGGGVVLWQWTSGRPLWRPELAMMLPLYPLWGFVQQLIFQGILQRRLLVLVPYPPVALFLTALVFSLVHLGDWRLVGLTAAAGAVWSWLFQRWPNVWALGASHGILAALAYPLLLSRDPLQGL